MKGKVLSILLVLTVVLTGCDEQVLYSDLTEKDANEMVSLLLKYQLNAEKLVGKNSRYSVATTTGHFAQAYELLAANGLPKTSFATVHDVFDKNQLVSSKLAIRARYNYAVEQEMSHTLSIIDGVLSARVHLAVPESDPLAESVPESSAAVLIKHREDTDLTPYIGQIKALVINGIENLPYENVTVALFPEMPMTMPDNFVVPGSPPEPTIQLASLVTPGSDPMNFYRQLSPLHYVLAGIALLVLLFFLVVRPLGRRESGTPSGTGSSGGKGLR